MKKVLLTICLVVAGLFAAEAQNKLGYINSNELLTLMPESKAMQSELESFTKGLESQMMAMQAEGETKLAEYQQNEATMSDLVKQDKVRELESIQQRIVEFQQNAQQALGAKEQELLTPILDKARKAIEEVAKEGNYTYIFDASTGNILYADENENVLPLVKAKLGL
ncbi:MAG: OmpH family outer membrane protein [Bacteroidetes bacterium]|nr:OmpH family outer membrane protein [Bacteroidota bacterium]